MSLEVRASTANKAELVPGVTGWIDVHVTPSQCSVAAKSIPAPTAQTSLVALAETPRRLVMSGAPGTTCQPVPSQCSIKDPPEINPTAHASPDDEPETLHRELRPLGGSSAGTSVHVLPSQWSIRGSVLNPMSPGLEPTAHTSS